MTLRPAVRPVAVVLWLALLYVFTDPYPSRFPGMDYEHLVSLSGSNPQGGRVAPKASLDAWLTYVTRRARHCESPRKSEKPKLVVVTVSGGAYRAGFWSAIVLDRLLTLDQRDEPLEGLRDRIRLLTGASGGMVASAYLAAMAQDRSEDCSEEALSIETRLRSDIRDSRDESSDKEGSFKTSWPIDRDSLAPVAQQMLQRDMAQALYPFGAWLGGRAEYRIDRGKVLEEQWITLDTTFDDLLDGEENGWRPSLILSPMLIETGQPLLISNLDLGALVASGKGKAVASGERKAVEFFSLFPDVGSTFLLQTAVRMNASFPYISPAAKLPTEPPRRVVDAGYYDNYGVNTALSWLSQDSVIQWINDNLSGVVIVEIRAYGSKSPEKKWSLADLIPEWLSSPIEGAAAARSSSMIFRNSEQVRAFKSRFPQEGFVQSVLVENRAKDEEIAMSWYVRESALKRMREELMEEHNVDAIGNLACALNGRNEEHCGELRCTVAERLRGGQRDCRQRTIASGP